MPFKIRGLWLYSRFPPILKWMLLPSAYSFSSEKSFHSFTVSPLLCSQTFILFPPTKWSISISDIGLGWDLGRKDKEFLVKVTYIILNKYTRIPPLPLRLSFNPIRTNEEGVSTSYKTRDMEPFSRWISQKRNSHNFNIQFLFKFYFS